MGNVQSSSEQRRSRRRFTIAESSIRPPSSKEPFLFATEPKHKSKDVQMYHIYGITEFMRGSNSAIHKAASRAVPGFAWYDSCRTEKCPLAVNGSRRQERPPEVVLYGGRPYGSFVNSAVRKQCQSLICTMCVLI